MDWSAFLGALSGVVVGVVLLLVVVYIWDEMERRKTKREKELENTIRPQIGQPTTEDILERQLEQHIIDDFESLFPEWRIYELPDSARTDKPKGVRLRTLAGEIDILCLDEWGNFVVIELKRNRASDKVIAQLDRYLAFVEQEMAQPDQGVRGVIIARSISNHLSYSLARRNDIEVKTYSWKLQLI